MTPPLSTAPVRSGPRARAAAPARRRGASGRRARGRPGSGPGSAPRRSRATRSRSAASPRGAPARYSTTGARSTSRSAAPCSGWRRSWASKTGCTSGRSRRQSSAVTRWIVPRMTPTRTTFRCSSSSDNDSRPEPVEPRPEPGIRVVRDLRLHADEVLAPSRAVVRASRSSRSCRASVARFSARVLSTSSHPAILAHGGTRPERVKCAPEGWTSGE